MVNQIQTNKKILKNPKKLFNTKQNILLLLWCIPNYITIYICKEKRKQLYTKRKEEEEKNNKWKQQQQQQHSQTLSK